MAEIPEMILDERELASHFTVTVRLKKSMRYSIGRLLLHLCFLLMNMHFVEKFKEDED